MKKEMSTIKLSKKTISEIAKRGKKGDTYEDIILKMMKGGIQNGE